MACICSVDSPSAFKITASGLPANCVLVNTSTVWNCRRIASSSTSPRREAKVFALRFPASGPAGFTIAGYHMFRQATPQMSKDFEKLAARAAPAIFVVLWSTGFVATKYVLRDAEPLTYLAIRMAVVVVLMAIIVAIARPP